MKNGQRIHGIDALRAIAMLLGVVFHATLAYKAKIHGGNQPHDQQFNSWIFDLLGFYVHSFRMPLFFIIAGYFCRFLYYKIGERKFILHRWKRIGIPLLVGIVTIVPLSLFPNFLYEAVYMDGMTWQEGWKVSFLKMFKRNGLYHLWFLYDLAMFYFITVVLLRLNRMNMVKRASGAFSSWWSQLSFRKWFWPLLLSVPIWGILYFERDLFVFVDVHFIPKHPSYILFYGYFFGLGWLLEKRTDIFGILIEKRTIFIVLGTLLCLLLFYFDWNKQVYRSFAWWSIVKWAAGFEVILLSLGFIGFFLHYFNTESYLWRYVSDASYWVYLTHLGLVVWLQLLFLNSAVPGILRFPLVLGIASLVTFVTYQWWVRYTFIGNILHGPRKRRSPGK